MKKYIKKISISIILVIISLTTIFYVKADSGWDSDYGGSDWGGSDWGGSSWDSDYGSNGSGDASDIMFILFLIVIVTYFILNYVTKKRDGNNNIQNNNNSYPDLSDEEYHRYFGMTKGQFKNKINKHFIDVQKSWMNFDYDVLRKLCTDELFNQYKTQLETLKLKNEQNIMSDFIVNSISVYKVEEVNDIVEVNVMLDISFKDYIINTNNNNVYRKDAYYKHFKSIFARYIKCKANKLKNCCFPNFNKNNFAALAYKYTGNPKEKDNYNFLKFTIKELLILGKNPKNKNRQYNNELLIKYIENHEEIAKDKITYIELINFLNNTVESELMKFYRNKTEFESINKDAKCLFFDKYYKNETGISLLEIDGFIKILKIKCK